MKLAVTIAALATLLTLSVGPVLARGHGGGHGWGGYNRGWGGYHRSWGNGGGWFGNGGYYGGGYPVYGNYGYRHRRGWF